MLPLDLRIHPSCVITYQQIVWDCSKLWYYTILGLFMQKKSLLPVQEVLTLTHLPQCHVTPCLRNMDHKRRSRWSRISAYLGEIVQFYSLLCTALSRHANSELCKKETHASITWQLQKWVKRQPEFNESCRAHTHAHTLYSCLTPSQALAAQVFSAS